MARPQSVGGGRPHRVSTALSRGEKADFDRIRRGMSPADFLRVIIKREVARQDGAAQAQETGWTAPSP